MATTDVSLTVWDTTCRSILAENGFKFYFVDEKQQDLTTKPFLRQITDNCASLTCFASVFMGREGADQTGTVADHTDRQHNIQSDLQL